MKRWVCVVDYYQVVGTFICYSFDKNIVLTSSVDTFICIDDALK